MTTQKTFRVRFAETNYYVLTLPADSKAEAIDKARYLYERHGAGEGTGFKVDFESGDTGRWEAEEITDGEMLHG